MSAHFFLPQRAIFFVFNHTWHSCSFFLCFPLSLFRKSSDKRLVFKWCFSGPGAFWGELCERQLPLLPIRTPFSTSYWEINMNCRVLLCQKANYLWLCNLINFKVKRGKHKLMDFPFCLLPPISLSSSLSLFYPPFSLFLSVTNGTSHSPTALNGAPSPPNGFSNGPSSSSSSSLANQQLPPACGARQLSKLKRFLTTLQQFGNDISPEIGERVRTLVLGLVVSKKTNDIIITVIFFSPVPSFMLDMVIIWRSGSHTLHIS